MKIKLCIITIALGLSSLAPAVFAGSYGDEAIKLLEKAISSAKSGDAKTSAALAEQAKNNLILEDQKNPYPEPIKKITGANPKQVHDEAAFDELGKAEGNLKRGNFKEAIKYEKNAETDIKQKEQAK